tara:strand:+ start:1226 stop:1516 length:291 start_codon:yes stop_codon:yes gene_type:complete
MSKHNWEHYHGNEDSKDNPEYDEGAYSFYDFDDEEVKQMEDDRIASLSKSNDSDTEAISSTGLTPSSKPTAARASAKERTQKFVMDGNEGSDFTAV